MKHNLIKTDNYLLVVDDSEIKENDWVYYPEVDEIWCKKLVVGFNKGYKAIKIIAHIPLNGAPYLDGVDVLPSLPKEDDVEELAEQYISTNYPHYIDQKEKAAAIEDVCWGYNKAKEKYKYTEQDVRAIKRILIYDDDKNDAEKITEVIRVIESLQQHPKYPIAFILSNKSETEWVGKYIYE